MSNTAAESSSHESDGRGGPGGPGPGLATVADSVTRMMTARAHGPSRYRAVAVTVTRAVGGSRRSPRPRLAAAWARKTVAALAARLLRPLVLCKWQS